MPKISAYSASTTAAASDVIPIDVGGVTKKMTVANILQNVLLGSTGDLTYDGTTLTLAAAKALTAPTITAGTTANVGSSGVAGTLSVFPTTASKGKLAVTVTDQTGNTTVSLVVGAMAAARTLTIRDPLANTDVLLGKQAGQTATATADGLTTGIIADGGCQQFVTVTSSSATNIITLPTPTPGAVVLLYVGANGFKLQSSTPASIAINGGTGASAKSAIAANSTVHMVCESATSWKGVYYPSDGTPTKVPAAA